MPILESEHHWTFQFGYAWCWIWLWVYKHHDLVDWRRIQKKGRDSWIWQKIADVNKPRNSSCEHTWRQLQSTFINMRDVRYFRSFHFLANTEKPCSTSRLNNFSCFNYNFCGVNTNGHQLSKTFFQECIWV